MQLPLFEPPYPEWVREARYSLCVTDEQVLAALTELSRSEQLALDTETSGLRHHTDSLVGISVCGEVGVAFYFPVAHSGKTNISRESLARLADFISDRKFVFHNSLFDLNFLSQIRAFPKVESDTLFLSRQFDTFPDNRLKTLGKYMLGLEVIELADLVDKKNFRFDYLEPSYAYRYACQDADLTLRLWKNLYPCERVTDYIHRLEMEILPAISLMERTGFPVDIEKARIHYGMAKSRLSDIERQVYDKVGFTFNISSPKQLEYVLFDVLGIKSTRTTEVAKKRSTGEDALKDVKSDHPVVGLLLEWREINKTVSSFYEPYFDRLEKQNDSRIYSHFDPWGARTGRFSSSDVNLQQVSQSVREIFVPEDGCYLVECDYSQIEYRIFASMCGDPYMVGAFMAGKDMHAATADRLRSHLNIDPSLALEDIPKDKRNKAKTLNFSVLFGAGDRNVASQLQCSIEEARELISEYYRQFPTVEKWKRDMHMDAVRNGYCQTKAGRRRYVSELQYYSPELYRLAEKGLPKEAPDSLKSDFYTLLHGLRIVVNTPVQGLAADIFKIALRRAWKFLLQNGRIKLHAVVHDSFIMSVRNDIDPREIKSKIKELMEIQIPGFVPIVINVKYGSDWKNMKDIEEGKDVSETQGVGRKEGITRVASNP